PDVHHGVEPCCVPGVDSLNPMTWAMYPRGEPADGLDEIAGPFGEGDRDVRAEAERLVNGEEKCLPSVGQVGESLFEANENPRLSEEVLELSFVLAAQLRRQAQRPAQEAPVIPVFTSHTSSLSAP